LKINKIIGTTIVVISLALVLYSNFRIASAFSLSASNGPVVKVSIVDDSFNPQSITVGSPNSTSGAFATIVWTNNGANQHTVTSGTPPGTPDGLFNSGTLNPGQNYTLQISQSMYSSILAKYPNGTVPYYCRFHYTFGMTGKITVTPTQVPEFPSFLMLPLFMVATLATVAALKKNARL